MGKPQLTQLPNYYGSGGADNLDEPFDLILSSYNFKIAQPFRFVYFDYYILINEVFLVIKRK